MTLRTFHTAGIAEKNVTLGLPRIIELVDARKKPATPSMDIFLSKDLKSDRDSAIEIARNILQTTVNDLVAEVETDYATEIKLHLKMKRLSDRGCTTKDVISALELNKKFKTQADNNNTVILTLNETLESSDVITLRNKILKSTVKGVPEIARVTLKEENNEWVIQTTGSNLAKVLEVQGIDTVSYTHLRAHET